MTTTTSNERALRALRLVLVVTAMWTLAGAIPGYLDPAASFLRFHGAAAESPLVLELYRGAWGQTLLFAIGYAIAALDPRRHIAIVGLGATGKVLFAARILSSLAERPPSTLAVAAAVGDLVFVTLLVTLFVALFVATNPRAATRAPLPAAPPARA
jgi:hypothetical protein